MPQDLRKKIRVDAKRVVVKLGSTLLTVSVKEENRFLDDVFFELIAGQVDHLINDGREVVIVSSGAIAAGGMQLGKSSLPQRITEKQAYAALGQPHLMRHYEEAFRPKGKFVGQVLLTHDDLTHRARYINSRHTLLNLLQLGAIPIVNENDTVAVEEIKVGDNDTLAAEVATLVDADLLILLTTVDGLLKDGKVIPVINKIDKQAFKLAGGPGSSFGIGGMATKLEAARLAGSVGIPTVIANGLKPEILRHILDGEQEGTLFMPAKRKLAKRKYWIAWTKKPSGTLVIDEGARDALLKRGKSLLPKGIIEVRGAFERGAAISIVDEEKIELARGLAGYSSVELNKIRGLHSKEIESALGYRFDDEAVHRDDLVLCDD